MAETTIVTSTEVFDFMGTLTAQRTTNLNSMIAILTQVESELTEMLGRSLVSASFSSVIFSDGDNCRISRDKIFLEGVYRDTYSITAISECGSTLTAAATYGDGNDYRFDSSQGKITKLTGWWSTEPTAILISGSYGYTKPGSRASARDDIKSIIKEMAAIKSGLWRTEMMTESGNIQVIKDKFSKDLIMRIKMHKPVSI